MTSLPPFAPRKNYGARYEPADQVLHGAGQSAEAFAAYTGLMAAQQTRPALYMTYVNAKRPPDTMRAWVDRLADALNVYPDAVLMPQIGLSMTHDGSPELHYEHDVAQGRHDESLKVFFDALCELGRPVYLRTGYECNGPWNGYEPSAYRDAFARVVEFARAAGAPTAHVWCVDPMQIEACMDWYPGDELVDWWSVDWFDAGHMAESAGFLREADQRAKPVMIGESTPRRVGVLQGRVNWDAWFAPYFGAIRQSPGIKAFCYINWNWAAYPQWQDWGDARLEANPELAALYLEEMRRPLYLHT